MSDTISTIAELEACVGAAGLPIKMKIIDHLDAEARRWIGASPVAFVAFGAHHGPRITVAGGPAGFAEARGAGVVSLPDAALDQVGPIEPGRGAGALFLVPGVGETLRVNGRVQAVSDGRVEIAVEECFVHCAKALIRSDFWVGGASSVPTEAAAFLGAARFLALATMDAAGKIDVSPKGDPAGLLVRVEGDRATLAERPGNRLAFGYRNILAQPRVAGVGLIPGLTQAVAFGGPARLTTDESLRSAFAVDGKAPVLATVIEGVKPQLVSSDALARAALWDGPPATPAIDPAAALVAHVKLNKARGAAATLLRLSVNRGLVASGLQTNYRNELY